MIVILVRFIIFIAIFFIVYSCINYLLSAKRKLELAHKHKKFYLLDDSKNVRKNFLLTYKGVLFEGEKYLGTTDHAFDIVSVFIWIKDSSKLQGLTFEDFRNIEEEVQAVYPYAKIEWKSPIKEFMKKNFDF